MILNNVPIIDLLNELARLWTLFNDFIQNLSFYLQIAFISKKLKCKLLNFTTIELNQGILKTVYSKRLDFSLKRLNLILFWVQADEYLENI